MTATIEGQTYEIPEMWVAGYVRTHGGDARDAALAWHEQAKLDAPPVNEFELVSSETAYGMTIGYPVAFRCF